MFVTVSHGIVHALLNTVCLRWWPKTANKNPYVHSYWLPMGTSSKLYFNMLHTETCQYFLRLSKNMCPYPRNFKNICIAIILWEKMCFCFVIGYFVLQLWQGTASSQSQQFLIKDERIYFVRISLYCCHNDATSGKRGTTNGQTLNYQTGRRAEKSISECFEQQPRCLRSIGWAFWGINKL